MRCLDTWLVQGPTEIIIALRDGVTGGKITNNTVSDSVVGVYLRDAAADVAPSHRHQQSRCLGPGAAEISVTSNIVSGSGPSAVDLKRAGNATASNNTTAEWPVTKQRVASFFQPLTILWTVLGLILVFTARHNTVACSNSLSGAARGLSNVRCTNP